MNLIVMLMQIIQLIQFIYTKLIGVTDNPVNHLNIISIKIVYIFSNHLLSESMSQGLVRFGTG